MVLRPVSKNKLILEYITYAYTLLYANSINDAGESGNFYRLCETCPKSKSGVTEIPYEDYYCSETTYHKIMDIVCSTPYILLTGKLLRKLTPYEVHQIRNNVALGCSPYTSKEQFTKAHPKFKKYAPFIN